MLNVFVNGCNGKMGNVVCSLVEENENMQVIGGFDKVSYSDSKFPIFTEVENIDVKPDVIIDFSLPVATEEASKTIPIFKSANMSFDIMLMKKVVSWLAPLLKNTDIEIIEAHHNRKVDSPSGTAQMLADSINDSLGNTLHCEYNRHDKHEKRDKNEIGMSSIRGGNIVGEHSVQFIGNFETFEIKHTSYSRNVFAEGALRAAEFIVNQQPGIYAMEDMSF